MNSKILLLTVLVKSGAAVAGPYTPTKNESAWKVSVDRIGKELERSDNAKSLVLGTLATESNFGTHPGTHRARPMWKGGPSMPYYGGAAQMDYPGFKGTKNVGSHPGLKAKHQMIKDKSGVDWGKKQWADIQNNMDDQVRAMFLHYGNVAAPVPGTRARRAQYYKDYYNTKAGKGTPQGYLDRTNHLPEGWSSNTRNPPLNPVNYA